MNSSHVRKGHQFRFIVAPEDGAQYDDLKDMTRRLMNKMEQDLNTKLDWVAVDHHNMNRPGFAGGPNS
ncbi:hypothetical protein [Asticcacaulis taihuensis]|uniref:hypothetical protein n=1 Tax=Asticcacaulis taihuensis TaxID=260084 RepID=UPI0026EE6581|nr:hypothetical protein [Asticcacaulis taihuensis]